MKSPFMALACLIVLALTCVIPEASAQDTRSATAEASGRAAREEPTLVAHRARRHCHLVKGHSHRDRSRRPVHVRSHRHCHAVGKHVAQRAQRPTSPPLMPTQDSRARLTLHVSGRDPRIQRDVQMT
jgi:hypothetical protein